MYNTSEIQQCPKARKIKKYMSYLKNIRSEVVFVSLSSVAVSLAWRYMKFQWISQPLGFAAQITIQNSDNAESRYGQSKSTLKNFQRQLFATFSL